MSISTILVFSAGVAVGVVVGVVLGEKQLVTTDQLKDCAGTIVHRTKRTIHRLRPKEKSTSQ